MTIILNEVGLARLFESAPVVAFVARVAERVVEEEQKNVRTYFGNAPSLHGRVDQEVGFQMEGSSAVIGIRDGGNKARRLARKEAEGTLQFGFRQALEAAKRV